MGGWIGRCLVVREGRLLLKQDCRASRSFPHVLEPPCTAALTASCEEQCSWTAAGGSGPEITHSTADWFLHEWTQALTHNIGVPKVGVHLQARQM